MIGERIRQFREHGQLPTEADANLARGYLDGDLLTAFLEQEPRDVVHSADTARWLLDRGHDDRALIQAALLHDIGKGRQRRRDRVAHVVASAVKANSILARKHSRLELRRALERTASHAETGADRLADLGAETRVVELVRNHHGKSNGDAMLELLQEADSAT